jgi:hypothetical protein
MLDELRDRIEATERCEISEIVVASLFAKEGATEKTVASALVHDFGLSLRDARLSANSFDDSLFLFDSNTSLGRLSGWEFEQEDEDDLMRLLSLAGQGAGAIPVSVLEVAGATLAEVLPNIERTELLEQFGTIAVSSSRNHPIEEIVELLPVSVPYEPDEDERRRALILSAVYLLKCMSTQGLMLQDELHGVYSGLNLYKWAPWILGILDPFATEVVEYLLYDQGRIGFDVVEPGRDPFALEAPASWVEEIRNLAALLADDLEPPESPVWFECDDVQIYFVESDGNVTAWVGFGLEGVLLSFDTKDFVVLGLPLEGLPFAAGCAIAWYLDCSLPNHRQIPGTERTDSSPSRGKQRVRTLRSTPHFRENVSEVAERRVSPPRSHYVAAHIRNLGLGRPNPAHVAQAPERLRRRMGSSDTWVRAHMRGKGNQEAVLSRLRSNSALADAIGMLRRRDDD